MAGNDVQGKAKIMDTPNGKIVKSLLDEGAKLGVSSRGMGSLNEKDGAKYVEDDFMLAAVDIVADPSAPSAFVDGIMEGKEFSLTGELEYDIRKEINNTLSKRLDQKKIELFKNFIKNLQEN